jgi:hypothetical protein
MGYEMIVAGKTYCSTRKVSFEAYYGDCCSDYSDPIRSVYLEHHVKDMSGNYQRKAYQTERQRPYYLHGDTRDRGVKYVDVIPGDTKLTAMAEGGMTYPIEFKMTNTGC